MRWEGSCAPTLPCFCGPEDSGGVALSFFFGSFDLFDLNVFCGAPPRLPSEDLAR